MAEARQLASQLGADIKETMENHRPAFTKLSMKLNHERLDVSFKNCPADSLMKISGHHIVKFFSIKWFG